MIPRVVDAKYVKDYVLYLRFSDGSEGEVNFEQELEGEIFKPLEDISYFKNFTVDDELHTLIWPNGADFAPEFLYEKLLVPAYQ
jgi:hypothetical protein